MLSISETATEMVNWVFPEHAGAPGQIHGGRMMQWIATCGTIAASRVARGDVVLGAMDDIDFSPVKVGRSPCCARVVRGPLLARGGRVFAEPRERALTLSSHLVPSRSTPVRPTGRGIDRGADGEVCTRRPRSSAPSLSARRRAERAPDGDDDRGLRWRFLPWAVRSCEDTLFGRSCS
jgi:hypothetical protein